MTSGTEGDAPRDSSRRTLFKQVGAAGAAALAGAPLGPGPTSAQEHAAPANPTGAASREARETLTATEADTLEAIVARLIPSDENGPGVAGRARRTTSIARS